MGSHRLSWRELRKVTQNLLLLVGSHRFWWDVIAVAARSRSRELAKGAQEWEIQACSDRLGPQSAG